MFDLDLSADNDIKLRRNFATPHPLQPLCDWINLHDGGLAWIDRGTEEVVIETEFVTSGGYHSVSIDRVKTILEAQIVLGY